MVGADKKYRARQGDIIYLSFDPQSGHEQAGRRPAVVVSNDKFNCMTGLCIVCPITSQTKTPFPLHVKLDGRTKTHGTVLCEQVKSLDVEARNCDFVETLPEDLLFEVVDIVVGMV